MTALNRSTRRRLQGLRQFPNVWEGDRRSLSHGLPAGMISGSTSGDCVLWVDGSEGFVRAMDVVPPEAGPEAVVRILLQAMEHPHNPSPPGRPQKIVVRDRELQFFLRGVLQDLDIVVDYVPELPLIDDIFQSFQGFVNSRPPQLPPSYEPAVMEAVAAIWNDAPWEQLDEEKIISVELNTGDVSTLYVSILGMLGMEYGLLMYRSLDSLKTFRQRVLAAGNSTEGLEGAFLEQDCLFVTFDPLDSPELEDLPPDATSEAIEAFAAQYDVRPSFGNLHPLEGMRPELYEDEAEVVFLALQAMHRFFNHHLDKLEVDSFPAITGRYRIALPDNSKKKISVTVSTLPDLATELAEMSASFVDEDDIDLESMPVLRNDLIPEDSFYSLGAMPWEIVNLLRMTAKVHQEPDMDIPEEADGYPVILIQTSRPKANQLIAALQSAGGVKAVCFNPGEDPFTDSHYDLGLIQTQDGELHLFGEFVEDDPVHIQARKKWDQRCKKTKGNCAVVIAMGLKGASRGNPKLNDMLALFEAKSLSSKELGLGSLQLMPFPLPQ